MRAQSFAVTILWLMCNHGLIADTLHPPIPIAKPQGGLHYRYYPGAWDTIPDFSAHTPAKQGFVNDINLQSLVIDSVNFGVWFLGCINIVADGQYTFAVSSDNWSEFLLDDTLLVTNTGSGNIGLAAGAHKIDLRYYQRTGQKNLMVTMQGESDQQAYEISSSQLVHDNKNVPALITVLQPDRNNTYTLGDTISVKWYYGGNGLPAPVSLSISADSGISQISLLSSNSGSVVMQSDTGYFSYVLPANSVSLAGSMQIYIKNYSNPDVHGHSDFFTVSTNSAVIKDDLTIRFIDLENAESAEFYSVNGRLLAKVIASELSINGMMKKRLPNGTCIVRYAIGSMTTLRKLNIVR
jgi:hypothetical protein